MKLLNIKIDTKWKQMFYFQPPVLEAELNMEILRTPNERFKDLKEYPFEPHYTTINTHDDSDLRIHHIDEGDKDGPIIL